MAHIDCSKSAALCERLNIDTSQTVYYHQPPTTTDIIDSKVIIDSLTPKEIAARVLHQLPEDTVLDEQGYLVSTYKGIILVNIQLRVLLQQPTS